MGRSIHLLLLALLCALALLVEGEVVMVYSIERHGARNVLPKSATLTESDANGGPTLLPEGQRQAWEAGEGGVQLLSEIAERGGSLRARPQPPSRRARQLPPTAPFLAAGPTPLAPPYFTLPASAGADYRARYIDPASCAGTCLAGSGDTLYGVVNSPGNGFNNYNMLVRSSGLDRTIMTALSFLDGALPPNPSNVSENKYLPDGQQVGSGLGSGPDGPDLRG